MLNIAGVVVGAVVALGVGVAPVAFAADNTNQQQPQFCGNQPFEGLALGILGLNGEQNAEKDEKCNDHNEKSHSDKHKDRYHD